VERGGAGHAENFAPVRLRRPNESREPAGAGAGRRAGIDPSLRWGDEGEIVEIRVTGVENGTLIGEAL
jgi:hypothetical protein